MNVLVDTNVVVGFVARGQPRHAPATSAVNRLLADDHELFLVPQVCYEFWVVATRPQDENGLGLSHADARQNLDQLQEVFVVLRDERTIFERWKAIVDQYEVKGKSTHDARLVAAMQWHTLTHI